jgi:hypothetical protein
MMSDEQPPDTPNPPADAASPRQPLTSGQKAWISLVVIVTVGMGGFWLLRRDFLESTALFIGLPAFLALALALTQPARSLVGGIFKGATIFLLLLGPVLREGFVCILMLSPLYYLVVAIIAITANLIVKNNQKSRLQALWLAPAIVLLSLESASGPLAWFNQDTVTVSRVFEATPGQIEAALGQPLDFSRPLPLFLALGFPVPSQNNDRGLTIGSQRRIVFDKPASSFTFVVSERGEDWVRLTPVANNSPVADWLHLDLSEIRWQAVDQQRTKVSWSLGYRRRLAPAWYFGPLERFGVGQAAGYLLETLAISQ